MKPVFFPSRSALGGWALDLCGIMRLKVVLGSWVALRSWVAVGGYRFCSPWVMGLMGMGFTEDFMCLDLGFCGHFG